MIDTIGYISTFTGFEETLSLKHLCQRTHKNILPELDISKPYSYEKYKFGYDKYNGDLNWDLEFGIYTKIYNFDDIAAESDDQDMLQKLFKHYKNANYYNRAIKERNSNIMALLTHGNLNRIAMPWASANGHLPLIRYLIKKKYPTNTAILWASISGHIEVIEYLIGQGIECGECELMGAITSGKYDVVVFLVKQIPKFTYAVITHAERMGYYKIAEYLMQHYKK